MLYTPTIKKAMVIAYEAHNNRTDKGLVPYIYHPIHLAEQMQDEESIIVALLHDVVEDSWMSLDFLREAGFSQSVLSAIEVLTHDTKVSYMDYIENLKDNPIARKVKIADLEHNLDLSRLGKVTDNIIRQSEKYKKALSILKD